MEGRITPAWIKTIPIGVTVIISTNLAGRHGAGIAKIAHKDWGIEYGKCEGESGRCYLIPFKDGRQGIDSRVQRVLPMDEIQQYINTFIEVAKNKPHMKYWVPRVGMGNAKQSAEAIAPLFKQCVDLENISLPQEFWDVLLKNDHEK